MNSLLKIALAVLIVAMVSVGGAVTGVICTDPGHGGSDPGAIGCSVEEEDVNLIDSNWFFTYLYRDTNNSAGGGSWTRVRTRGSDVAVSLQGRCDISNNAGANRFVSIHHNCCGGHGTETYCYGSGSSTSFSMRDKIQSTMCRAGSWALTNRGNKTANFYVLIHTNAPAALCEMAFIDSCSIDKPVYNNATKQQQAGRIMLFAIQRTYGLAEFNPD